MDFKSSVLLTFQKTDVRMHVIFFIILHQISQICITEKENHIEIKTHL